MVSMSNEEVVRAYLDAHTRHDFEALGRLRSEDWLEEWPQSGERVRGHSNDQAIMTNWPGGIPQGDAANVVGSEDRWVMTPSFTYQRITGEGEHWWADAVAHYPDGSTWFAVGLFSLRAGQVHRERWFFGPQLEAPGWRAEWVERIDQAGAGDRR